MGHRHAGFAQYRPPRLASLSTRQGQPSFSSRNPASGKSCQPPTCIEYAFPPVHPDRAVAACRRRHAAGHAALAR